MNWAYQGYLELKKLKEAVEKRFPQIVVKTDCHPVNTIAAGVVVPYDQVIFYLDNNRIGDAVCNFCSYGYELGELEVMGPALVPGDDGGVEGNLLAEDVVYRLKEYLDKIKVGG